jgi:hypothetical protein
MDQIKQQIELNSLISVFEFKKIDLPVHQSDNDYFPAFVSKVLSDYYTMYIDAIKNMISDTAKAQRIGRKIKAFNLMVDEVLKLYYQGDIFNASRKFNSHIQQTISPKIPRSIQNIQPNQFFYRSRINDCKHLTKEDLFHIKFEQRHLVSTNRYSVPGFPSLYLADSPYTCWEEFNRFKVKEMWFSKYINREELKVVKIERSKYFIRSLYGNVNEQLNDIYDYLVMYPLSLVCSIKVKNPVGGFKPEYIIPQMLLQYISLNNDIDGIKFPSTKVDYSKVDIFILIIIFFQ